MRRDDSWFEKREGDPLKEWIREGTETLEDPDFEDRVMEVVSRLPVPIQPKSISLWQLLIAPAVRRVGLAGLLSVFFALLMGWGGVELLLSTLELVSNQIGGAVGPLNTEWSDVIAYWLPIATLLIAFRLLDQTMATVRHRVLPGS